MVTIAHTTSHHHITPTAVRNVAITLSIYTTTHNTTTHNTTVTATKSEGAATIAEEHAPESDAAPAAEAEEEAEEKAEEEADLGNASHSQAKRQILGGIFGDDFCEESEDERRATYDRLWGRLEPFFGGPGLASPPAGYTPHVREAAAAALDVCFNTCTSGGAISQLFNRGTVRAQEAACDEAVHWLPPRFSPEGGSVTTCSFYPQGNQELKVSACFWGNCVDETALYALLMPAFWGVYSPPVESDFDQEVPADPEPLFDRVKNPTRIRQAMQQTFAMHCAGAVTVYIDDADDLKDMRHTLVALMGYNKHISIVEFKLGEVTDPFPITDALENLIVDWQDSLCREFSRVRSDQLTPSFWGPGTHSSSFLSPHHHHHHHHHHVRSAT